MKDFADIKKEIYGFEVKDPSKESKYGKFLDTLVFKYDLRGKDERWDLWYFSDNTEFCRDSAKHFLEKIKEQYGEHGKLHKSEKDHDFRFNKLRILFGCFCFYLYAALESFAHEINIFYEIDIDRKKVGIKKIAGELRKRKKDCALSNHLQTMFSDTDFEKFFEYRNTVMHGYVYPISGDREGLFLKDEPKIEMFSFEGMNTNLLDFCTVSYSKVCDFICKGWRCFEIDELTDSECKGGGNFI